MVMVLAVLAGASATVALAVRHHGLSEIIVTAVNVGLLAVACLALVVARSQAVAARAANALMEQARQETAAKEREAAAQAIADSQRATRPYLWADLVPGIAGPQLGTSSSTTPAVHPPAKSSLSLSHGQRWVTSWVTGSGNSYRAPSTCHPTHLFASLGASLTRMTNRATLTNLPACPMRQR